jgi:LysR family transcriptional activator of nhaA
MALPIPRLNYQHLLYFWAVVRTGSLRKACEELHLSAPTVSSQLRTLEERLGEKLLTQVGRGLAPTETGRMVYGYAEEIFGLGVDLLNALAQRPTRRPMRVSIGVDDVVPKEIAQRVIESTLSLQQPVQLSCREGALEPLLDALRAHEIDAVISDSPATPSLRTNAYNHLLGGCDVVWMAAPALAKALRPGFPRSFDGARILLPTADTAIRRALDQWLDRHSVRPEVVAEFEDYAMLREFARAGLGAAPVPEVLAAQFRKESGMVQLGAARKVRAEFYVISLERKIRHPAMLAMTSRAEELFAA